MAETVSPEPASTPTSPTTDAELGVIGAQQARADRRARRAMAHADAGSAPRIGVAEAIEIRARALALAQDAVAAGIIASTDVLATADTYAAYIRGDNDGREG